MFARSHPRFTLVIDCACGRRFFRHREEEKQSREAQTLCACGNVLGAWSGAYTLYFEPQGARDQRYACTVGLSPHC